MSEEWMLVSRHGSVGPLGTEVVRQHLTKSPLARDATAIRASTGESLPTYEWEEFADLARLAPQGGPVEAVPIMGCWGIVGLGVLGAALFAFVGPPLLGASFGPFAFLFGLGMWLPFAAVGGIVGSVLAVVAGYVAAVI